MLKLLNIDKETSKLVPVTSTEYFVGKTTTFHPEGFFSEKIFGAVDTSDRRKIYSFIDLNCNVLHPALFGTIRRLKRSVITAMSGEKTFTLQNGELILDEDGEITGMSSVVDNWSKIKFSADSKSRADLIGMVDFYTKKGHAFTDKCIIIPPDYRQLEITDTGDITVNPLNDYYLKILRLSLQLRTQTSGPVYDVLAFRMHELVLELYNYLTSKVSKKKGLLRSDLLGKRVDFTARAVISGAASELRADELGIPLRLLVKLFEPFIIFDLLNSGNIPKEQLSDALERFDGSKLSALSLRRLFIAISKHDEISQELYDILVVSTNNAIKDKIVLAKRDPSLHAESVQAFKPVLVDGNTIRINPMKCSAYNADFDGDQMAVYVPITRQAIEEAKDKMMVTTSKDSINQISDSFDKDSAIGIYLLTKDSKSRKAAVRVTRPGQLKGLPINDKVKYGTLDTTVGRIMFNDIFPDGHTFINEQVNQKKLNNIANEYFITYGREKYVDWADKILKISYKYGTIGSPSFGLEDLEIPKSIVDAKKQLVGKSPQEADRIIQQSTVDIGAHLEKKDGNLGTLGKAGVLKGGYDQARQILVAKGLISDNEGNIQEPIAQSYAEGMTSKDFFMSGAGSRRGIADRVLNTADTGYLSRQLVFALQRVEADPTIFNCKTQRGFQLKVTPDIARRLEGRYYLNKVGNPIKLDPSKAMGKVISLKSPLYCISPKICKTCYGDLLERNRTPYVGVLAGQIFGERGTQMIMKCSDGLVHHNSNLIAFKDLWNSVSSDIDIIDGKETKELPSTFTVQGKEGEVKALTIQKHDPTEKMMFITTKSGHTLVCQSNHPLWIKKTSIHSKYSNDKCRLIGDRLYNETQSTRTPFTITDEELIEIEASELTKHDAIWIDSTIASNNKKRVVPGVSGYVAGIYCAEGCKAGEGRNTKGNIISQHDNYIKPRIISELKKQYNDIRVYDKYITIVDNDRYVNDVVYGSYAWEKRLPENFIDFSKSWLKDFLSGMIDGDGTVFNTASTCCRVYTCSYYLVQQIKAICDKLGYKCNTCIVPPDKEGSKGCKQKRPNFAIDIRFLKNENLSSEKLKANGKILPIKIRRDLPVRGFDVVSTVKDIWKWDYPVYDIQTNTKDYMLGGIQNHNTFHSGGAISVTAVDIIKPLTANMDVKTSQYFSKMFSQKINDLVTKTSGSIIINRNQFLDPKKDIKKVGDTFELEYGYFEIVTKDRVVIDCALDFHTHIPLKGRQVQDDGNIITIPFSDNSAVFTCPASTSDFSDKVRIINHLLSGKKPWKSADHFCMKIYDQYGPMTGADMVHFEILASQLLRDKSNPSFPARLNKDYNAIVVSLKKIPSLESWLSALSFENPGLAVMTGLTYDRDQSESILEQMVNGTL